MFPYGALESQMRHWTLKQSTIPSLKNISTKKKKNMHFVRRWTHILVTANALTPMAKMSRPNRFQLCNYPSPHFVRNSTNIAHRITNLNLHESQRNYHFPNGEHDSPRGYFYSVPEIFSIRGPWHVDTFCFGTNRNTAPWHPERIGLSSCQGPANTGCPRL